MSRRHPLALVAAGSVVLASVPLSSLFASLTWLLYSALAIGLVVAAAMVTRAARGPVWAQVLVMAGALLLFLTLAFPSGDEFFRLFPTSSTFQHFNDLLVLAGQQIRTQSVPAPDTDALLLLTTLGVGLVAIVVDVVAVGLHRPALAGLPMLAIYSVPVAILPNGVPIVMFLFSAVGYLWLLVTDSVDRVRRFGRRFTGEGRDVDIWEPSPLAAAGRRLGLVGLVIAIVVPLAVPGLSSGLLDSLRSVGDNGTGVGSGNGTGGTVDLSAYLTDQLLKHDTVVPMVQVSTTDPDPFYLRFGVADQIKNNGFVPSSPTGGSLNDIPTYNPGVAGIDVNEYQATIVVTPNFRMNLAPFYQELKSVDRLDGGWLYDSNAGVIFARSATADGRQYTVHYLHVRYTPDLLRLATSLTPEQRNQYKVPPVPQVSELVDRLTAAQSTEYDQVRAIYDYFTKPENNFRYSVQTPASKSDNPIVDFLDAKIGFCVQYAAAMAWLTRAAGIPARVAFGFTRGNGPNAHNVDTLSNVNLHAWTEVYFPSFGWVPFDATPADGVTGGVRSAWAPDPSQPQLGPSATASPGPAASRPDDTLQPKGGANGANGGDVTGQAPLVRPWVVVAAALITVLLAIAITPALRRRALTRRRRARSGHTIELDVGSSEGRPATIGHLVTDPAAIGAARRDAHAAWAELHDTMLDFGVDVDDAETPRATAQRVGGLLGVPNARGQARLLGRAEERARYARVPLRADGLNEAVRDVRGALAERATRWERISVVIMPRSVLLRWRLAMVNRIAGMVAASARARASFSAANPRRALSRASH